MEVMSVLQGKTDASKFDAEQLWMEKDKHTLLVKTNLAAWLVEVAKLCPIHLKNL